MEVKGQMGLNIVNYVPWLQTWSEISYFVFILNELIPFMSKCYLLNLITVGLIKMELLLQFSFETDLSEGFNKFLNVLFSNMYQNSLIKGTSRFLSNYLDHLGQKKKIVILP